jgi:hypothetical protein
LPKRNYSGCHCEGVFCPKQSRVEQEKPCFGRLLHSQKALVRSNTPVSSGWLNSYAKTKNLPYRQMISAPKRTRIPSPLRGARFGKKRICLVGRFLCPQGR